MVNGVVVGIITHFYLRVPESYPEVCIRLHSEPNAFGY
eukprot:SAG11_NODE_1672_length_4483_cov_3.470119_1_plen_38_part_00